MTESDVFNVTRRRFRYGQSVSSERANMASKQRMYKQILDEQVEQKRRMQQLHQNQQIQQKAWYVQPSESYQPRSIFVKDVPQNSMSGVDVEKERMGVSRFVTEPYQQQSIPKLHQHKDKNKEDDEQINGYLLQCEKILESLKELTVVSINKSAINENNGRKFIKLNRNKQLLVKSEIEQMEKKFMEQYEHGTSKLPSLGKISFSTPKNMRGKDGMAVIINPMPCTHSKFEGSEDSRSKKKKQHPLTKTQPRDLLTSSSRQEIEHLHTVKVMTPRSNSRNSLAEGLPYRSRHTPLAQLNPEKDEVKVSSDKSINNLPVKLTPLLQTEDKLVERSRKTQLEVNKERFRMLARQPSPQDNPDSSEKLSSLNKPGDNGMMNLVRVKAHGYKLFEKVKRYNRNRTEQKQYIPPSATNG